MYQAITLRTRSFVHPPTILSRRINTFHHSSFSSFKKINVHNSSFNQNYLTYNKTNKIYSFKEHSEIPNCVNILKSDPKIDQKIKILFSQKRCYYYRHSVNRYDPGIYGRYSRLSPRTRRRLKLLGLLLLLLSVYILLNIEEAPVTRRKRLMLLSPEHDRDLGAQTIEAFFASVGEHRIYPVNHPVAKTVRRIGMRIVAALEEDEGVAERYPGQQDLPDLPHRHHSTQQHRHHHDYNYDYNDYDGHQSSIEDHSVASKSSLKSMYQWNFYVVDSPEINAFCAPGGDVVVFSGLLNLVDNEDQLASVLSHEISHAIARHGAEKLSIQRILSIFQIISAGLFDFSIHTSQIALDLAIANPYSRLMEKEADTIGIKLMAKACFDPRAAPQVMEKLADVQGGSSLMHYLSTHPPDEERIAELYQLEPEAFDIMMRNCPPGRRR